MHYHQNLVYHYQYHIILLAILVIEQCYKQNSPPCQINIIKNRINYLTHNNQYNNFKLLSNKTT